MLGITKRFNIFKKVTNIASKTLLISAASILLVFPALNVSAAQIQQSAQFGDPNPEANDLFGYALAVSSNGHFAVVGSPGSTYNGSSAAGTAYIFSFDGTNWNQVAQLIPTDRSASAAFGTSVSITPNGSEVVVGAQSGSPTVVAQSGSAYVFTQPVSGWW